MCCIYTQLFICIMIFYFDVKCWLFISTNFCVTFFVADCKFNCHKKCAILAPKDCQGYSKYASYMSGK